MRRRQFGQWGLALGAGATLAPARAQAPGPLRIVVPFGAGGIADLTVRVLAQEWARSYQQSVVVDNRPGAGGVVATDAVAKAPADGKTLLLLSNATAISAGLFRSLPFDVRTDLQPISLLGVFDFAVLVPGRSPLASFQAFLAEARQRPGALNVGTINKGSTQHLSAELLLSTLGIRAEVVPFNGSPALLNALRGQQVDIAVEGLAPTLGAVRDGALRALATLGLQRSQALPQTPTVAESDPRAKGFQVTSWNALAAPAGTPAEAIARLHRMASEALATPRVQEALRHLGVEAGSSTPQELAALLAQETAKWKAVIQRLGLAQ